MKKIKKNKVYKTIKKNWKLILGAIFIIMLAYKINQVFFKEPEVEVKVQKEVELINISKINKPFLENQCKISSENTVSIISETGGKITKIYKNNNSKVKKGDLIISLKSLQQQAAVQNAKVSLSQAELALKDMTENTSGDNFKELEKQQELVVKNAYTTFLNSDLQFYPEDDDEVSQAPTISGNYSCGKEGKYILETYSSGSKSGGSFRFSGLESGVQTVQTTYSANLGECGLQVKFPQNFRKDVKWVLEIPNKKSSRYQASLQNYELAKQNQNLSLQTNKVSDEKVSQQRGVVKQARISLQIAYDNLAKTQIRANSNGVISGLNLNTGDTVGAGQMLAKIKGTENIEAVTFFNQNEIKYISKNSESFVDGVKTKIKNIGSVLDDTTGKMKVVLDANNSKLKKLDGQYVDCKIKVDNFEEIKSSKVIVPISSLSVIGDKYFIFYVENNKIKKQEVKTGGIFSDKIEIFGFEESAVSDIVKDTRGLYENKVVKVKK